ncbi:MAG: rod shape-determining protein MreD [Treponema sp.]|nr:rod shape-determining protein MreD [Treponema sp.]
MAKSFLTSIAIIFCASLIETAILSNLYILPVVPDLILICSVYISLLNGKTYGQLTGFVSGITLDFVTGVPFGLNCLFRTLTGYIYGLFSNHIVISGLVVPVLTVSSATLLKAFLIWFISLFYTSINPVSILSFNFLFELITNIILAPIVFKFLSFFKKTISIKPENNTLNV